MPRKYHPTVKRRMNTVNRVAKCQAEENKYGFTCERCEQSWYHGEKKPNCLTHKEVGRMWINRMKQMFGGDNG